MNEGKFTWGDGDIEITSDTTTDLSDTRWYRALTPAEKRINFSDVDRRMNELEARFADELQPIFQSFKDGMLVRLRFLIDHKDLAGLDTLDARLPGYADLIVSTMRDAYDFAKSGAANEIFAAAPATKRETLAIFRQNAKAVVQKQLGDMLFALKAAVLSEARRGPLTDLHTPTVLDKASQALDTFYKSQMALGGTAAVAMAINRGRGDVFEAYHDQIAMYQYSAILDKRTCAICTALDGSTTDYVGYQATKWKPPIHFWCRCIWAAILKTQKELPAMTGFPTAPGGVTDPSL